MRQSCAPLLTDLKLKSHLCANNFVLLEKLPNTDLKIVAPSNRSYKSNYSIFRKVIPDYLLAMLD
jgi:hypothetical protein